MGEPHSLGFLLAGSGNLLETVRRESLGREPNGLRVEAMCRQASTLKQKASIDAASNIIEIAALLERSMHQAHEEYSWLLSLHSKTFFNTSFHLYQVVVSIVHEQQSQIISLTTKRGE